MSVSLPGCVFVFTTHALIISILKISLEEYPHFKTKVYVSMIVGGVGSWLLGAAGMYYDNGYLILFASIGFCASMTYAFRAQFNIKCPRCQTLCEDYQDLQGQTLKVFCSNCNKVWDVGICYNSSSD
ncbi:MAG: hypothetical protein HQL32_12530 [Planctomycetes bacterium]|nr:hypothetical protein [Planctomycetota bacterium]